MSGIELPERLTERIAPQANGCWHWVGNRLPTGYGQVYWSRKTYRAHRLVYELAVGPIPTGLWIDHTCHNGDETCAGGKSCLHRLCVNPLHLEAVSPLENALRSRHTYAGRTHCKNGHPLSGANLALCKRSDGRVARKCRRCNADRVNAIYHAKKRIAAA